MKLRLCLLLLLVVLLVTDVADAKRRRKGRRRNKNKEVTTTTTTETPVAVDDADVEDELDMMMDDDAALEEEQQAELRADEDGEQQEEEEEDGRLAGIDAIIRRNNMDHDPCEKKTCGKGRECTLTDDGEAVCTCVHECTHESDPRRQVCTNHNETWNSDCAVYRQRCQCTDELEDCQDPKNKHLHVEYYGQCRDVGECSEEEMADFPRRMREWLFNVMKDLAERQQLGPLYTEMEQEAEADEHKRWSNAAVWRWCELDTHPADSSVSRHELFPIRATLFAMEHCISSFLDGCDSNADGDISLSEWAQCLQVTDGEIKERCERIKQTE